VVALALPAFAQQVTYSDEATQFCLSSTSQVSNAVDCAGKSAETCMNTSAGGFSTVVMTGCLDREISFWDKLLNSNYKSALARAAEADEANAGTNAPSQQQALREMQRAWIPFRDASCEYARSQWGNGTGGGPAALACLLDQTARQAILLDEGLGQ
jgi:uncharacterized protein YecT (DUF1311 family)